ncbi:MAG: hypothetical protein HY833_03225, partial [Candidatus Aenigmarchaeota archaeon]|nr:hypothetical protein [Candidatus Aenigmarchaeota archaeon]
MKLSLAMLVFLIPALIFASPSYAQSTEETSLVASDPSEVSVGIYVLNVGKFEVATGSYTIDFYLDMKCPTECDPSRFEFSNGRANTVDKIIDTPTEKFYRIQASLSQNIDLRKYPFDSHKLSIVIEDKVETKEALVYKIDPEGSGIDPEVSIVGWDLNGWGTEVGEHFYVPYDETYSRYTFNIDISRPVLPSFIKSMLPVFFMIFVSMLSLLLAADKVTMRLSLNISTLLAAVMFHLNITSQIPPVGYMTFA